MAEKKSDAYELEKEDLKNRAGRRAFEEVDFK